MTDSISFLQILGIEKVSERSEITRARNRRQTLARLRLILGPCRSSWLSTSISWCRPWDRTREIISYNSSVGNARDEGFGWRFRNSAMIGEMKPGRTTATSEYALGHLGPKIEQLQPSRLLSFWGYFIHWSEFTHNFKLDAVDNINNLPRQYLSCSVGSCDRLAAEIREGLNIHPLCRGKYSWIKDKHSGQRRYIYRRKSNRRTVGSIVSAPKILI